MEYKLLADIFQEVVEGIRPQGSIISIIDNTNDTYTIGVAKLSELLIDYQYINITDSIGFTNTYQVLNVNYTNNSFDIILNSGVSVPVSLGSFKALGPYDYFSGELEYQKRLSDNVANIKRKIDNFPGIHLHTDFKSTRNINSLDRFDASPVISFINYTSQKTNTPQKHDTEIPYLFSIFEAFTKELKRHKRIVKYENETNEIFYSAEMKTNNQTNLIVMEIDLTFLYRITDCNN